MIPIVFVSMLEKGKKEKNNFLILHCKAILHCNQFLTQFSPLTWFVPRYFSKTPIFEVDIVQPRCSCIKNKDVEVNMENYGDMQ